MHNRRRTINLHDSYHALQGHTLVTAGVSSIKHWTVEHLKLEAQAEGVVLTAAATAAIPAAGTRPSLVSAIATAGSGGINGLAVAPSREGAIRSISGSSSSHNEAGLGTTPSGTQAVAAGMTNAGPPAAEADATTTGATPFASAGVGVPEQPLQPPLQPPEEATTDTVNHAPQLLQPAVAEPAGQQAPQPVPASYFAAPAAAPSSRPYVSPAGASPHSAAAGILTVPASCSMANPFAKRVAPQGPPGAAGPLLDSQGRVVTSQPATAAVTANPSTGVVQDSDDPNYPKVPKLTKVKLVSAAWYSWVWYEHMGTPCTS